MKLYDFLSFNDEEQYNITWNIGTLVDQIITDHIAIHLYAINDFFVEVYYEIKSNRILYKKIFKQGELLEKYLNRIKL